MDNLPVRLPPGTPDPPATGLPRRLRSSGLPQDDVPAQAVDRAQPGRQDRALALAQRCARIAAENRAKDILLLDLRQATPLVDFFVIATAAARRQAQAITSDIDAEMKREGELKLGIEGAEEGKWILLDYGDFVVHIFTPESRTYYALEDIWGDASHLDWETHDAPGSLTQPE